jgi:hypothetical protein
MHQVAGLYLGAPGRSPQEVGARREPAAGELRHDARAIDPVIEGTIRMAYSSSPSVGGWSGMAHGSRSGPRPTLGSAEKAAEVTGDVLEEAKGRKAENLRDGTPRGLRVRCSAYPNVHRRTSVQVTARHGSRWTALDLGELQLKLQLEPGTGRASSSPANAGEPGTALVPPPLCVHPLRNVALVCAWRGPSCRPGLLRSA